ncbi:hypothetical protein NP233_g4733 [Leucocoprinus birnbaumii]|uniref:MYND-type domain-containing protein n=1 Tax=Leucocoprinus birnbaumii TaxID=56174 RepID=A0AAD5VU52_9AGAR|nr:hypothetical protein NP233_g4733 [Leucocoprinus birnbaumii]
MANYYSHQSQAPPAANFDSIPNGHPTKQRNTHVCDSCGNIEPGYGTKFRVCGGCLSGVYCSKPCQDMSWPTHRAVCRVNAQNYALAHHNVYSDPRLAKQLRNFISAHEQLFQWAGFQALQVKRMSSNIRHKALLIVLDYQNHPKLLQQFSVAQTQILPMADVMRDVDPAVIEEMKRREARSRNSGGLGCMLLLVQCGMPGVAEFVPVELPRSITWDARDDWEYTLRKFVSEGRTDFLPISTTSRGIVYG